MKLKNIFRLFLIIIFVAGSLNFAYANGGPVIGENQAKKVAQNYLNSNNLSYTAITHGWDDLQVNAIDTKTGQIKWIPVSVADEDSLKQDRYHLIDGDLVWIVQVNDKNNESVGQIYVDANTAEVIKAIIDDKVLKGNFTDTLLDNMGIIMGILGIICLSILGGIGYLIYKGKPR